MVKFRVLMVLMTALFVATLATSSVAQQSTRADFEEFCDLMEGRWVGDVVWTADWPGMGKRGDRVTAYIENRVELDGKALVAKYYGGQGAGMWLTTYDAGAKTIKEVSVSSGGTVWNSIYYKKDGKWICESTGSNPDGKEIKDKLTLNISDNGNTHRCRGQTTLGGEQTDELQDVWRRVTK